MRPKTWVILAVRRNPSGNVGLRIQIKSLVNFAIRLKNCAFYIYSVFYVNELL
jgi:hypothetical protein